MYCRWHHALWGVSPQCIPTSTFYPISSRPHCFLGWTQLAVVRYQTSCYLCPSFGCNYWWNCLELLWWIVHACSLYQPQCCLLGYRGLFDWVHDAGGYTNIRPQGVHILLLDLSAVCSFFAVSDGAVTVGCDSLASLSCYLPDWLKVSQCLLHMDLVRAIWSLCHSLPICIIF